MLPPFLRVRRWRKDVPPKHLCLFIQLHDVISQITVTFTVKSDRITHNSNSSFDFLISSTYTYLSPPASFFCETSSLQFRYNCPDSFTEYSIGQQLWPYKTNLIQQLHQFLSVLTLKSFSSKTFYACSLATEFGRSLVTIHLEVVLEGQSPDMDTIILMRLLSSSGQLTKGGLPFYELEMGLTSPNVK